MVSTAGGSGPSIGGIDELLVFIVLIGVVVLVAYWKAGD